jgi:phosphonate metabolism protein (transferase hexapeptide repeat family)
MSAVAGKPIQLGIDPTISDKASIKDTEFGIYCQVGDYTSITESRLGDYSYVVGNCNIIYTQIGKFCSIASHVRINPGQHPLDHPALHHFTYRSKMFGMGEDHHEFFENRRTKRVVLENDVWVGHGAVIMPGVKIGTGAAIGSGAIVTRDVPQFSISAGSPARIIRYRFPVEIQEALMDIAWWDWEKEALQSALQDFRQMTAEAFVSKHGR